jgi:hypothetical protein
MEPSVFWKVIMWIMILTIAGIAYVEFLSMMVAIEMWFKEKTEKLKLEERLLNIQIQNSKRG